MNATLRDTIVGLPGYTPMRFMYQSLFDREAVLRRKRRRQFYSLFLRPGDLVFDVGANLGNYAEAMCGLGAQVIAIEPDPRNIKVLQKRLKRQHIRVEPCALGSKEGTADLRIASNRVDASTLSEEWAKDIEAEWKSTVRVPVRTLDSLANQYGIPKYVKIDAEGFDAEILRGMSFRPEMVSFEFHPHHLEIAQQCVQILEDCTFNFVIEQRSQFELQRWVTSSEIFATLTDLQQPVLFGDVFARTVPASPTS